ncbi:MAG: tetratricopeptide repeat protein [Deltaproteobacteria bacterium]|nr:tetratricopeptide repeat protein [Deltaproteobacteria bacterium]
MNTCPRTLLLLILPLLLAGDLATGRRFLAGGQHRLAIREFREILEERPNNASATLGLGRALAGIGECEPALAHLGGLRGAAGWNGQAALAEAECLDRLGWDAAADAGYQEALHLAPERVVALFGLALVRLRMGDDPGFEEAVEALSERDDAEVMVGMASTWEALERGHADLDVHLLELQDAIVTGGAKRARVQLGLVDGQRWLDLGDPWTAAEVLGHATRGFPHHVRAAAYRAEALRRTGDVLAARDTVDRPAVRRARGSVIQAIRARILVDLGDLEGAESAVGEPLSGDHPEVLASLWYLARARGESARAVELEASWRERVDAADRTLDQLLPAEVPR